MSTIWIHHREANKRHRRKLVRNNARMLCAVFNQAWKQHPIKHQLHDYLPLILQIIHIRWRRHAGRFLMDSNTWTQQCWPTSKDLRKIKMDWGCSLEDLPEVKEDRDGLWENVIELSAVSMSDDNHHISYFRLLSDPCWQIFITKLFLETV